MIQKSVSLQYVPSSELLYISVAGVTFKLLFTWVHRWARKQEDSGKRLQGYLTHKKQPPPPKGHDRALGIVLQ